MSWQTTIMTWRPFSGQTAYVGAKDNFLINLPFIALFDHYIGNIRTQLLDTAIFFGVVNFTLFYLSSLYFIKKAKLRLNYLTLMPFIWLASFGFGFASLFLNTVWRDFETGVSFVFYMVATKYYFNELDWEDSNLTKVGAGVMLLLSSLFVYSDPYFFYFTLLPIAVMYVFLYKANRIGKDKLVSALSFTLTSLIIARVITTLIARVGILAPAGKYSFTGPGHLASSILNVAKSLCSLFGVSMTSNEWYLSLVNLGLVLVVAGVIAYCVYKLPQFYQTKKDRGLSKEFFSFTACFLLLCYIGIDNGNDSNSRYLMLFVYVGVLLLVLFMNRLKSSLKTIAILIGVLAIGLNIASLYRQSKNNDSLASSVNRSNYRVIEAVERLGLSKGYGNYWDGNINTYLSDGQVNILPVTCGKGQTKPLPLLINGSNFSNLSDGSFYVVDPTYTQPVTCSVHSVMKQFGKPTESVKVGNKTILVYNYDIYTKMVPLS